MRKTFLSLLCGLLTAVALFSCVDDNLIGGSLQPDQDVVTVRFDSIKVKSETKIENSVYLRNSSVVLGEFTDSVFGTIKSDFLSQLYCPYKFKFPDDIDQIDSANVYLYYTSYFGDSTAVHHANVWYLDKAPLERDGSYNSTTNPADYCSKNRLLASGTFTTGDFQSSDSVKQLSTYTSSKAVKLKLDEKLCKQFLADNRAHPEYFASPDAFNKYFNGIYVTTDYGNGSLLYITHAELEMIYSTHLQSNAYGETQYDSLVVNAAYFPINKEVRQVNRAEHGDMSRYIQTTPGDSLNYIYSPAGMYTKITLPDSIFTKSNGKLSGSTINSMKLCVKATQVHDDGAYTFQPPTSMLLVDASKADAFFTGFEVNDGTYSFIATYNSDSLDYEFDLSYYAQKMVRKNDDPTMAGFTPFTEMYMMPVTRVKNSDSEYVRLEHLINPAAVKVCSASHPRSPMLLKVVYSKR